MEKLTSINIKSIVAKVNEIIDSIKLAPEQYDDTKLRKELGKQIADINRRQDDLARSQNALDKAFKAIEIPKVPSVEPLRKRIKALEDKPQYIYDDKALKTRIKMIEDKPVVEIAPKDDGEIKLKIAKIEQSIESLDKRLEFVKRTYSEKWETMQYSKASDNNELNDKLSGFESDIAELKKSIKEIFE